MKVKISFLFEEDAHDFHREFNDVKGKIKTKNMLQNNNQPRRNNPQQLGGNSNGTQLVDKKYALPDKKGNYKR